MPNENKVPAPFPADIVQVVNGPYRGAFVVVEEVRSWGVTGYAPSPADDGTIPLRLRHGEYAPTGGIAVVGSGELAKARETAIATAREAAASAPPVFEDFEPLWDVTVRFNGRTTGAGQSHSSRVEAETCGDALERAIETLPVVKHGGSVYVSGVSAEAVRK